MRASQNPQRNELASVYVTKDFEIEKQLGLGSIKIVIGSGAAPALDFSGGSNLQWTPDNAAPTVTSDGGYVGQIVSLDIMTWGTSSTVTFGTGFKVTATLVTGVTTGKKWNILFKSDGTNYWEISRSPAVVG